MAEKIRLTGAQATLLGTLYAKALDARGPRPVLGDTSADQVLRDLDHDLRGLKLGGGDRMTVVLRAKQLDEWVLDHLHAHPDAVVLHLACGLDSRAFRLNLPAGVRWFDVDHADVIALRRRFFGESDNYRTIATSVTEPGWLEQIPAAPNTLVVAEGLTPYLAEADGIALLRRLTEHFPSGQLMFDAVLPWVLSAARFSGFLHRTGAEFQWAIGDPHGLRDRVPGLRLLDERSPLTSPHLAQIPVSARLIAHAMNTTSSLRNALRLLRYEFG